MVGFDVAATAQVWVGVAVVPFPVIDRCPAPHPSPLGTIRRDRPAHDSAPTEA